MGRPRKYPPLFDQLFDRGNRRLFVRKPLTNKVIFEDEWGDPLLEIPMTNLSLGGIFLQGALPIRPGSRAFLSFTLPASTTPIRLVGEIVRLERERHTSPTKGLGVRFVEVPPAVRTLLETWLNL